MDSLGSKIESVTYDTFDNDLPISYPYACWR